jgi:hypothetical protein
MMNRASSGFKVKSWSRVLSSRGIGRFADKGELDVFSLFLAELCLPEAEDVAFRLDLFAFRLRLAVM